MLILSRPTSPVQPPLRPAVAALLVQAARGGTTLAADGAAVQSVPPDPPPHPKLTPLIRRHGAVLATWLRPFRGSWELFLYATALRDVRAAGLSVGDESDEWDPVKVTTAVDFLDALPAGVDLPDCVTVPDEFCCRPAAEGCDSGR